MKQQNRSGTDRSEERALLMNQRFKSLFGEAPKSFPLREGGHIICGNALRLNWLEVCPPPKKKIQKKKIFDLTRVEKVHATTEVVDDEVETYVVGNPPYAGSVYQTPEQKRDMELVFASHVPSYKDLDYVATKASNHQFCNRFHNDELVHRNAGCPSRHCLKRRPWPFRRAAC
jgi:hypothetical protein